MSRRKRHDDDMAIGCVVYLLLAIFLMPFVGIYFLCKPEQDAKILGGVLLVLGAVLWIWAALA